MRVIGHRFSKDSHDLRDFLARNRVPARWMDVERDGEARELLQVVGVEEDRLPVALLEDGSVLERPTVLELAERSFAAPVRIGVPGDGLGGLADSVRRPKFSTAAGLAVYGSRRVVSEAPEGSAMSGASVNGVIKWMRDWISDFF